MRGILHKEFPCQFSIAQNPLDTVGTCWDVTWNLILDNTLLDHRLEEYMRLQHTSDLRGVHKMVGRGLGHPSLSKVIIHNHIEEVALILHSHQIYMEVESLLEMRILFSYSPGKGYM